LGSLDEMAKKFLKEIFGLIRTENPEIGFSFSFQKSDTYAELGESKIKLVGEIK
jgi:hypothetical protein